jgi:hypothetical protein
MTRDQKLKRAAALLGRRGGTAPHKKPQGFAARPDVVDKALAAQGKRRRNRDEATETEQGDKP